jgi:hypothetical protein
MQQGSAVSGLAVYGRSAATAHAAVVLVCGGLAPVAAVPEQVNSVTRAKSRGG